MYSQCKSLKFIFVTQLYCVDWSDIFGSIFSKDVSRGFGSRNFKILFRANLKFVKIHIFQALNKIAELDAQGEINPHNPRQAVWSRNIPKGACGNRFFRWYEK